MKRLDACRGQGVHGTVAKIQACRMAAFVQPVIPIAGYF
jgi:hypothetical protein